MIGFIVEVAWKTTLVAVAAWLALSLARSRSSAEKAMIARLGLVALLLTPAAIILAPPLHVALPQGVPAALDARRLWSSLDPRHEPWVQWLYLVPALALAARRGVSLIRLAILRSRAEVVVDAEWLSALALAQRRAGSRHGAALLESEALPSPVSWGLLRPTILLNADRPCAPHHATFIVAHELSHVLRLDWLTALLARTATTLFWFNPLVWQLARETHQLCEEAADDAVLADRTDAAAEYASLLVQTARRRARTTAPLIANPMAPAVGSLKRRIERVLAVGRRRAPPPRWAFAPALTLAVALTACVGAVQPTAPAGWATADSPVRTAEQASVRLEAMAHPQARALGRALASANWPTRRIRGVSTFYEPAAMDALVLAAQDGRPVNRRIAVWGLSEIDPQRAAADPAWPAAVDALQTRLQDPSPAVRGLAARALAQFGHVDSAGVLEEMLADPDPTVRAQAAHAVGDLQLPGAIEPLTALLDDPDPTVRREGAWALARCREAQIVLKRSERTRADPT